MKNSGKTDHMEEMKNNQKNCSNWSKQKITLHKQF